MTTLKSDKEDLSQALSNNGVTPSELGPRLEAEDYPLVDGKQIVITVKSIKVSDQTQKVVCKLRKMNEICDKIIKLRAIQQSLQEKKEQIWMLQQQQKNKKCLCKLLDNSKVSACRHERVPETKAAE